MPRRDREDREDENEHEENDSGEDYNDTSGSSKKKKKGDAILKIEIIDWKEKGDETNMTAEEVRKGLKASDVAHVMKFYNKHVVTNDATVSELMNRFGDGLINYLEQKDSEHEYHLVWANGLKLSSDDSKGMCQKNSFQSLLPVAVMPEGGFLFAKGALAYHKVTETEFTPIKTSAWIGLDPELFPFAMYTELLCRKIVDYEQLTPEDQAKTENKIRNEEFGPFLEFFNTIECARNTYNNDSAGLALGLYSIRYDHKCSKNRYFVPLATNNTKSVLNTCKIGSLELTYFYKKNSEDVFKMCNLAQQALNAITEKTTKASLKTAIGPQKAKSSRKTRDRPQQAEPEGQDEEDSDIHDSAQGLYLNFSSIIINELKAATNPNKAIKELLLTKHEFEKHPLQIYASKIPSVNPVAGQFANFLSKHILEKWLFVSHFGKFNSENVVYTGEDGILSRLEGMDLTPKGLENLCKVQKCIEALASTIVLQESCVTFATICITRIEDILKRSVLLLVVNDFEDIQSNIVDILNIIDEEFIAKIDHEFVMSVLYSLGYLLIHEMQYLLQSLGKLNIPPEFQKVKTALFKPHPHEAKLKSMISTTLGTNTIADYMICSKAMLDNLEKQTHKISFELKTEIGINTTLKAGKENIQELMIVATHVDPDDSSKVNMHFVFACFADGWHPLYLKEIKANESKKFPRTRLDDHCESLRKVLQKTIEGILSMTVMNKRIRYKQDAQIFLRNLLLSNALDIAYIATRTIFEDSDLFYKGKLPLDVQGLIAGEDRFDQSMWPAPDADNGALASFEEEFERFLTLLGNCESIVKGIWCKHMDPLFRAIMFLATIPAYRLDRATKTVRMSRIPVLVRTDSISVNPQYLHMCTGRQEVDEDELPFVLTDAEFAALPPVPQA